MEVGSFEEYIEVAEVARRLGISTTTVYNRIKKEWAPFVRKEHGLTLINVQVLGENAVPKVEENTVESLKDNLEVSKHVETSLESALKDQIESLKRENERLEKLLDDANLRIGEKDGVITSLSERLADLTERALKTTEQAQFLTAQAQAAAAALPEPEPEEETEERRWFRLPKLKKKK